jgi:ABC-type branched-subunit amino acid transport system ATPase component
MAFPIELRGASKSFAGVKVLNGVSFDMRPGEVHALLGENGAGKSTLIKIMSGLYQADEGEILVNGNTVKFATPRSPCHRHRHRAPGIAALSQLTWRKHLSVRPPDQMGPHSTGRNAQALRQLLNSSTARTSTSMPKWARSRSPTASASK